jgi:hypothetical protein
LRPGELLALLKALQISQLPFMVEEWLLQSQLVLAGSLVPLGMVCLKTCKFVRELALRSSVGFSREAARVWTRHCRRSAVWRSTSVGANAKSSAACMGASRALNDLLGLRSETS